jgi:hypothetical protein
MAEAAPNALSVAADCIGKLGELVGAYAHVAQLVAELQAAPLAELATAVGSDPVLREQLRAVVDTVASLSHGAEGNAQQAKVGINQLDDLRGHIQSPGVRVRSTPSSDRRDPARHRGENDSGQRRKPTPAPDIRDQPAAGTATPSRGSTTEMSIDNIVAEVQEAVADIDGIIVETTAIDRKADEAITRVNGVGGAQALANAVSEIQSAQQKIGEARTELEGAKHTLESYVALITS